MASTFKLAAARYGKTNVRVLRVIRDAGDGKQDVAEYNVTLLVEGEIETSYTEADNTCVVATDSMKNIVYGDSDSLAIVLPAVGAYRIMQTAFAKTSPYVMTPELFASHLGVFMLQKYAHLKRAIVDIEKLKWTRLVVNGAPHAHSFVRDGDEKEFTHVEVDGSLDKQKLTVVVKSGLKDLLVLKSTGSAFENFVRDEYTTLVEVSDRILSTAIDLSWSFEDATVGGPDDLKLLGERMKYGEVAAHAKAVTLEIFATDESASVQATLFKMAGRVIEAGSQVKTASYTLPNKHYVPVPMEYLGISNVSPQAAEVYVPLAAPSGLISATVSRG